MLSENCPTGIYISVLNGLDDDPDRHLAIQATTIPLVLYMLHVGAVRISLVSITAISLQVTTLNNLRSLIQMIVLDERSQVKAILCIDVCIIGQFLIESQLDSCLVDIGQHIVIILQSLERPT